MRFGNLIFGAALLLVATTLALTITLRNDPADREVAEENARDENVRQGTARNRGTANLAARARSTNPRPRAAQTREPDPTQSDVVIADDPATPLSSADRLMLSEKTGEVRNSALHRLDTMTEEFGLTPEQRRKIFPHLVRSVPGFHEAMVVSYPGGKVAPIIIGDVSPDEAIHDALDPDQQDEFLEEQIDKRAWWDEIVTQLEEDYDSSLQSELDPVAAGTAPEEEEAPAEETPSSSQGGNIFDLLNEK